MFLKSLRRWWKTLQSAVASQEHVLLSVLSESLPSTETELTGISDMPFPVTLDDFENMLQSVRKAASLQIEGTWTPKMAHMHPKLFHSLREQWCTRRHIPMTLFKRIDMGGTILVPLAAHQITDTGVRLYGELNGEGLAVTVAFDEPTTFQANFIHAPPKQPVSVRLNRSGGQAFERRREDRLDQEELNSIIDDRTSKSDW